jgi:hypothetical protein
MARVVALSGGHTRADAASPPIHGMIASFSQAPAEDLRGSLGTAINLHAS